jgi:hypothetical protein
MRDGIGDPRWRIPRSNLEQRSGLVRELQRERKIGFALLRGRLQPLAEDHGRRECACSSPGTGSGQDEGVPREQLMAEAVTIAAAIPMIDPRMMRAAKQTCLLSAEVPYFVAKAL